MEYLCLVYLDTHFMHLFKLRHLTRSYWQEHGLFVAVAGPKEGHRQTQWLLTNLSKFGLHVHATVQSKPQGKTHADEVERLCKVTGQKMGTQGKVKI